MCTLHSSSHCIHGDITKFSGWNDTIPKKRLAPVLGLFRLSQGNGRIPVFRTEHGFEDLANG